MKSLIATRHGAYSDGRLTEDGREQVRRLAERIAANVGGQSVCLFASPARRTVESAEIIARRLDVRVEIEATLAEQHVDIIDGTGAFLRKRADDADVIILVTHLDIVLFAPMLIDETVLAMEEFDPERSIPYAGAVVVDLEKKTTEYW